MNRKSFENYILQRRKREHTDEQLETIPFSEARWLKIGDMERWVELHNKTARLYHINANNELKEVPAQGWWY